MRLFIHDFAGHPFAAELSRELARRGHGVTHGYCGGVTTGRGAVELLAGDPDGLRFVDVSDEPFERYSPMGRLRSEVRYGRRLDRLVRSTRPEAVLSANCPLTAQAMLWRACGSIGARRVYWLQDFLGRGTRAVLASRSAVLGSTLGRVWERLEITLLRRSNLIIAISDDFRGVLSSRGVRTPVRVIRNWTPLGEITIRPKRNRWAIDTGLVDATIALYSGTLGLKHDPEHLVAAAQRLEPTGAVVVVVSEGVGRQRLQQRMEETGLGNLRLFDFVPYGALPDLLGTADVCLVLLEPDAGAFSVPSKVLTYLAAGRPIVGAVPSANLASRTIQEAGAGTVVNPGEHEAFADAVEAVLSDDVGRATLGAAARRYAEEVFDIARIADEFEAGLR